MSKDAQENRFRSLDGLRAMCIIIVMIGHLELCLHLGWSSSVAATFHVGKFAVRMFLAISGFLITTPLLKELATQGDINLRRYYVRRTLRVFPAYYAFLAVLFLLTIFGVLSMPMGDFGVAATYTTDYLPTTWPVGHGWSLSVQEQFYLLWPLILLLLGGRRALLICAALLVLAPLSRALMLPGGPMPETRLDAFADSLAVGCLMAGYRDRMLKWDLLNRWMKSVWGIVLPVLLSVLIQLMDRRPNVVPPLILNGFLLSVQNAMIVLILHWSLINVETGIGRFLNSRVMVFIGAMSYSIYLWQQPFLNPRIDSPWTHFPLNLIGLAVCALISYYCVELPAFAWRRKVEARVSRTNRKPTIRVAAEAS